MRERTEPFDIVASLLWDAHNGICWARRRLSDYILPRRDGDEDGIAGTLKRPIRMLCEAEDASLAMCDAFRDLGGKSPRRSWKAFARALKQALDATAAAIAAMREVPDAGLSERDKGCLSRQIKASEKARDGFRRMLEQAELAVRETGALAGIFRAFRRPKK